MSTILLVTKDLNKYHALKGAYYSKDEGLRDFVEKNVVGVTFDGDLYICSEKHSANNNKAIQDENFYNKELNYSVINIDEDDAKAQAAYQGIPYTRHLSEEDLYAFFEYSLCSQEDQTGNEKYYIVSTNLKDVPETEIWNLLDSLN